MILSTHFTLAELEHSNDAAKAGITNNASRFEIANLVVLCKTVLEPLRERFGPLGITSGFRNARLNALVKGESRSAHRYGCAADLHPLSPGVTVADLWHWLAEHRGLPVDQAIWEKRPGAEWLHVGTAPPYINAPRGMALKIWR